MGTLNVQAAEVDQVKPVNDTVEAIVPDYVSERLDHPDVIYTKDGIYEKQQLSVSEYNQDEVSYDVIKTTTETEVLVVYDATYLKISDNSF